MKASNKNKNAVYAVVLSAVVLVLGYEAHVSMAVTCNPTELSPCLSAFSSGGPPSKQCCTKANEQKPCLCQYIKNPSLKQYVNSPNSKKVLSACGVPVPNC